MKMFRFTRNWDLSNEDTITYIVQEFYYHMGAKITKASVHNVQIFDKTCFEDGSEYVTTIINFHVRCKDIGADFAYTLDTTNGWIEKRNWKKN